MFTALKVKGEGHASSVSGPLYSSTRDNHHYQPPEIILQAGIGVEADMWSVGCVVGEMLTGKPLFPGDDDAEVLMHQMEVLGYPPAELVECGGISHLLFAGRCHTRPAHLRDAKGHRHEVGSRILKSLFEDKDVVDFLRMCLQWNPQFRMTPEEALLHTFLTPKRSIHTIPEETEEAPRGRQRISWV